MTNNENTRYIYLRSTKERIPCTQEEFDNYYRDINTYRKAQQRHGKCVCPANKRLDCDMDCMSCPFRRAGDSLSLDFTTTDEDGNEIRWADNIEDPSVHIEDIVADSHALKQLFARLNEIMPEAIEIGKMRMSGKSDLAIAEEIGIRNTTFRSRLDRAKKIISEEFPEFF